MSDRKKKLLNITLCAMFAALICVGAFIRIPTPLVPITFQVFFTTLAGLILGGKKGALSVAVYVLMGLAGIPVFTGGGGLMYVLKPTFGYLIGFIAGAYLTGEISHAVENPSVKRLLAANFAGLFVVYLVGTVYCWIISHFYMHSDTGIIALMTSCVFLPIGGDILLSFILAFAAKRIIPITDKYLKG